MGANWYDITGSRQDYITYFLRGREVSIELSSEKMLPSSELPGLWDINHSSLRNFLYEGLRGLQGEVHDSETNNPVRARIYIPGHDSLNSYVYSHEETGRFFRYLATGSYDLWVEADGFVTEIIKDININYNNRTQLDIRLKSVKTLLRDRDNILIYPNPFSVKLNCIFRTTIPEDTEVEIYDLNGKKVYSSVFISSSGINYKTIDLSDHPSGIYFFKLIIAKKINTLKIIKAE